MHIINVILSRRGSRKFFQGGPTLKYNCGSAQIWKLTIFFISSDIGDIKLCKFQVWGGEGVRTPHSHSDPPLDPRMLSVQSVVSLWYKTHYISNTHCIGNNDVNLEYSHPGNSKSTTWQHIQSICYFDIEEIYLCKI